MRVAGQRATGVYIQRTVGRAILRHDTVRFKLDCRFTRAH